MTEGQRTELAAVCEELRAYLEAAAAAQSRVLSLIDIMPAHDRDRFRFEDLLGECQPRLNFLRNMHAHLHGMLGEQPGTRLNGHACRPDTTAEMQARQAAAVRAWQTKRARYTSEQIASWRSGANDDTDRSGDGARARAAALHRVGHRAEDRRQ